MKLAVGNTSRPRLRPPFLYSARHHLESFVAALSLYRFVRRGRLLAAAGLFALLVTACGRYGPLEPPPDPNAPPKPANPNGVGSLTKPSIPPIKAPNQPFFLDFLLK